MDAAAALATVPAAAAALPDPYRAMAPERSSTGAPCMRSGTPVWPCSLLLVFRRSAEFAPPTLDVPWGERPGHQPKLRTRFGTGAAMGIGAAAPSLGFLLLTGAQALWLFAAGALPIPVEALNAIVAVRFVPLPATLGALAVFARRRTGGDLAGVLIGGVFVAWYAVAGTAAHVAR